MLVIPRVAMIDGAVDVAGLSLSVAHLHHAPMICER